MRFNPARRASSPRNANPPLALGVGGRRIAPRHRGPRAAAGPPRRTRRTSRNSSVGKPRTSAAAPRSDTRVGKGALPGVGALRLSRRRPRAAPRAGHPLERHAGGPAIAHLDVRPPRLRRRARHPSEAAGARPSLGHGAAAGVVGYGRAPRPGRPCMREHARGPARRPTLLRARLAGRHRLRRAAGHGHPLGGRSPAPRLQDHRAPDAARQRGAAGAGPEPPGSDGGWPTYRLPRIGEGVEALGPLLVDCFTRHWPNPDGPGRVIASHVCSVSFHMPRGGRARHLPLPARNPRRTGLAGARPARPRLDRRAHHHRSAAMTPTGTSSICPKRPRSGATDRKVPRRPPCLAEDGAARSATPPPPWSPARAILARALAEAPRRRTLAHLSEAPARRADRSQAGRARRRDPGQPSPRQRP
jgi:hypothetical protein